MNYYHTAHKTPSTKPKGLYNKGTVINRKTQAKQAFAVHMVYMLPLGKLNRDWRGSELLEQFMFDYAVLRYSEELFTVKSFKNISSDLPPIFLLYVEGHFITLQNRRRRSRLFYTSQSRKARPKGATPCKVF